jgi:hypothetical protein
VQTLSRDLHLPTTLEASTQTQETPPARPNRCHRPHLANVSCSTSRGVRSQEQVHYPHCDVHKGIFSLPHPLISCASWAAWRNPRGARVRARKASEARTKWKVRRGMRVQTQRWVVSPFCWLHICIGWDVSVVVSSRPSHQPRWFDCAPAPPSLTHSL